MDRDRQHGCPVGCHTATLLPSGKVLAAGGYYNHRFGYLSSAELYDRGGWAVDADRKHELLHALFTRRRCYLQARCWWLGIQRHWW